MHAALGGATARLSRLRRPWCGATDAATTFCAHFVAAWLERAVSEAPHHSRRHEDRPPGSSTEDGSVSGSTRLLWFGQTVQHVGATSRDRCSGKPSGHFSPLVAWKVAFGRRRGSRGSGAKTRTAASSATKHQAHCSTPCPAHGERDMRVSRDVRQAASALEPHYREQFAHGILPSPATILPMGLLERSSRCCGTTDPQTGSSRGHIFADGSSAGSGALRRAGWAAVAVDGLGNLKAAAYGAVPCDVFRGRHRAMARTMQLRRQGKSRWTRSRCTSIAKVPLPQSTVQSARRRGQQTPTHMFGADYWLPTTRSELSRSRGTPHSATWRLGCLPTVSKKEMTLPTFSPRKGLRCTSHLSASPRLWSPVLLWPCKLRAGQRRPTSCSGFGAGTTLRQQLRG